MKRTRTARHNITLTPRGERVLACAYTVVIMTGTVVVLLGLMGLAGWIETGL
jgi:MFS superfamily sulfate permease-like transporter